MRIIMNSRDRGFTLLELLLVIIIITLVLALAYPSLSRGSAALHLRATGRDILNTFRYAREKAITEQCGMRVTVDREKQQLTLTDDFGEGDRTYSLPKDVRIEHIALTGNETTENSMTVRFLPNGSCDSGELLLKAEKGSWLKVITDPITGGARIEYGSGGQAQ
jgi:prepilin-type N-terminal cleavage/methylation domain-containing protein